MAERPREPAAPGTGESERRLGAMLVSRVHAVLRSLRLYDAANQMLQLQVRELGETVRALMHEEVTLFGMGDAFYVNGVRLRATSAHISVFGHLLAEFEAREIQGIRCVAGVSDDELLAFLTLLATSPAGTSAVALAARAAERGVQHVTTIRLGELKPQVDGTAASPADAGEDSDRQRARLAFARAVHGTRDLLGRAARNGRPALHQARRVVQPLVDRLLRNENSLVGLTALKTHDEYTYQHCVNVSVLSIRMGQILGLTKAQLANLGVAALLHDVGKLAVPRDVLRKPGPLDDAEWALIHRHPVEGLRAISRLPGLSSLMLDAMRVAFEHHRNLDGTGYPRIEGFAAQESAYSRIVAVADFFDAVTSHRAYRARPMTPCEALRLLLGPEREKFDPGATRALVHAVGLYPAGTVLVSRSGYLLLSLSPNPDDLRRPVCRVIGRPNDAEGPEGEVWSPMPPHEQVARIVPPEELPIDVEDLLAA